MNTAGCLRRVSASAVDADFCAPTITKSGACAVTASSPRCLLAVPGKCEGFARHLVELLESLVGEHVAPLSCFALADEGHRRVLGAHRPKGAHTGLGFQLLHPLERVLPERL